MNSVVFWNEPAESYSLLTEGSTATKLCLHKCGVGVREFPRLSLEYQAQRRVSKSICYWGKSHADSMCGGLYQAAFSDGVQASLLGKQPPIVDGFVAPVGMAYQFAGSIGRECIGRTPINSTVFSTVFFKAPSGSFPKPGLGHSQEPASQLLPRWKSFTNILPWATFSLSYWEAHLTSICSRLLFIFPCWF